MKEPAIWFFTLLQEAHKREARELQFGALTASVPQMKDSDRKRYIRELERAQRDIMDVGNKDYSGLEKLKSELGEDGRK